MKIFYQAFFGMLAAAAELLTFLGHNGIGSYQPLGRVY
jgi:hypothetical protein